MAWMSFREREKSDPFVQLVPQPEWQKGVHHGDVDSSGSISKSVSPRMQIGR